MNNIHLHIKRLVLDRVRIAPNHQHLLQVAVATELERLLTEGGLATQLSNSSALPALVSPSIQLDAGADMTGLGSQIARAVYGAIGK